MVDLMVLGELCGEFVSVAKEKDKGHNDYIFPSTHPKVNSGNHFPIGDERHGRSALQEMGKYTVTPKWWKGSLSELKNAISRAVHSKYPGIKSEKKKKSAMTEAADKLRTKIAQNQQTDQLTAEMNKVLSPFGYVVVPGSEIRKLPELNEVAVSIRALSNAKFKSGNQAQQVAQVLSPLIPNVKITPTIYS
jgi:hypothetical protein